MTLQKISHIFTKIALKPLRTNLFHIVLLSIFLTIGNWQLSAQETNTKSAPIPAEKEETNDDEPEPDTEEALEISEKPQPIQNEV